ncbi:MAG: PilZ domain-containing protein [Syntrophobacter sp.]
MPIEVRLVPEEERANARSRTSLETALTENQEMPEPNDRILAECLRVLNTKLDTIIRLLALQTADYSALRQEEVNISAGGLSTFVKENFQLGDMVEVRMMLPTSPYTIFYIYGNIVKIDKECNRSKVSIEFTMIDEDIREHIVKYVFERQREILRKKRRQEAD